MQEDTGEENKDMGRIHNCGNVLCIGLPLVIALSCLLTAGLMTVDRGHLGNGAETVYNDFPKLDYTSEPAPLPCADLDDYDTNATSNQADEKQKVEAAEVDEAPYVDQKKKLETKKGEEAETKGKDADISEDDDEEEEDKEHVEETESKDFESEDEDCDDAEPANGKAEVEIQKEEQPSSDRSAKGRNELSQEADKDAIAGYFYRGDDAAQERPIKKSDRGRSGHKMGTVRHDKVKLKELGPLDEKIEELEKEVEIIAERDPAFKEKFQMKRNDRHKKSKHERSVNRQDVDTETSNVDEESSFDLSDSPLRPMKRRRVSSQRQRHLSTGDEASSRRMMSKRDAAIDVDDWTYTGDLGTDKWEEKWPDCGGNAQSPVNLDTSSAKIDYEPLLKWKGYSNVPSKMTLINNGHSVVLTSTYEDCGNKPYIWDSLMNHEYVFGELTFHWGHDETCGAEHTLDYMKYPLEMQVVHYRRDLGSIEKAQEVPGGVAIVAILYHLDTTKRQNQGLADIQAGFGKVRDGPTSATIAPFPLSRVIPQFSKHYLAYNGSLTTPPCTETVIWIVHQKPASITKKQLLKFHHLKNEGEEIKSNNRPVQQLNRRCVFQIT